MQSRVSSLDLAKGYAERGWRVFKCNRDKTPATPNGLNDGTTHRETLEMLFYDFPDAPIGISTGLSDLVVLDVDKPETVKALIREHPDLVETYVVQTGGGGAHFYYHKPGGYMVKSLNRGNLAPELPDSDIKSDGGYVIAAGSRSTKGEYKIVYDHPVQKLPGWLFQLLLSKGIINQAKTQKDEPKPTRKKYYCGNCAEYDTARGECYKYMAPKNMGDGCASHRPIPTEKPMILSSIDHTQEAHKILETGDPVGYIMDEWHRTHKGDDAYGRLLLMSICCGSCTNTEGLHPQPTGESGGGKSHAMKCMYHLLPGEFKSGSSVSPKALYYDSSLRPGTVIWLDDLNKIDEDLEATIKIATSRYQEGTTHKTVDRDKNSRTLRIPGRCTWWITSVYGDYDKQVLNRVLCISVDSETKDEKERHKYDIHAHQLRQAMLGDSDLVETREVLICREIFKIILSDDPVIVRIPYTYDVENDEPVIRWKDKDNSRNLPMFLDIIRSCASLHRYQRHRDKDGRIIADLNDYDEAGRLWSNIFDSQTTKLTKSELKLYQAMKKLGATVGEYVDVNMLQKEMGLDRSTIHILLMGRDGKSGMVSKFPGLIRDEWTETQYDVDVVVEDTVYGERERKVKTGSKSKPRKLYTLIGQLNELGQYGSNVSISRDRAEALVLQTINENGESVL